MTRVAQRAVSRPIVRYHGGKWKLAPWVISHMPLHRIYVEPFGGGASVLLRKPRSYAEVYNDQWHTIVNVFRVLRDPVKAERLRQIIELTPYSRDEFFAAYHDEGDDDVERARKTILRSFAGFGPAATNGEHITGFRGNCGRSGMTPAHDWRNYPGQVPAFVERLQAVIIESRPAQDVIAAHDSHQTLFYVDPPYPHSTRNMSRGNAAYAVEMTDEDHERLAHQLRSVAGMVMMSGYDCDLYSRLYADWYRVKKSTHADGARDRIEVLWLNPACAAAQRQQSMAI